MLEQFMESLPHGSGIDGDWSFTLHKDSIRLSNEYHCMNDAGFYDGWSQFVIIIPKDAFLRGWYNVVSNFFKLQFLGRHSQYLAQKYFLREYLEDTFAIFFRGL